MSNHKFVRKIKTSLSGKKELFRLLALAESTSHPLLFVGPPGVAKTNSVRDYASSQVNGEDHTDKVFFIETDEDTRPSELKGVVNVKKLYEEGVYEKISEVPTSDVIVINEIDKADASFRNGLLSIMNEKVIFNGVEELPCSWKLFVATCNSIPEEEVGNHFWDRFPIRYKVNRTSRSKLSKLASEGFVENTFELPVPTKEEIDAITISEQLMKTFVSVMYPLCTDRTILYTPRMIKAVSIIWDISIKKAMIKVASLLTSASAAQELSTKLQSRQMTDIMNQFVSISYINDPLQKRQEFVKLSEIIEKLHKEGVLTKEDLEELSEHMNIDKKGKKKKDNSDDESEDS